MGKETGIQWCHHTFNGWRGCDKISDGCALCYAWALAKRNPAILGEWGPNGTRVVAAEGLWCDLAKWNREAQQAGERRRVFAFSLADVFEDWRGPMKDAKRRVLYVGPAGSWMPGTVAGDAPANCPRLTMQNVRERLWSAIKDYEWLDFLLVTKRPENVLGMVPDAWRDGFPRNVWMLASVENQAMANERLPYLMEIPAVVLGVSAEPLLEEVDFTGWPLNWIIVGGESSQAGKKARPFNLGWARTVIEQNTEAAVYVKQLGSNALIIPRLKDGHGGDWMEWPADLRVREFPRVGTAETARGGP